MFRIQRGYDIIYELSASRTPYNKVIVLNTRISKSEQVNLIE